jgi:cystathionine beta-lyase
LGFGDLGRHAPKLAPEVMRSLELTQAELFARPGIKCHRYPDDVLPAWIAGMDFDVAESLHATMRRIVADGVYGYEDPSLYPSLAEAFAAYMQHCYAWPVDLEWVLLVAHLVEALYAAVGAINERA